MASWSAAADEVEVRAAERARRRRATASRHAVSPLRHGVATITIVAAVLAGLVALNVAVLELNVRLDQLGRERSQLRDRNAALASQLSSAKASPRIQARARERLGLVQPKASEIIYVDLGGP